MTVIAIFDTETTGIPKHPSSKPSVQPRIIEFGGVLVDETGEELDRLELLVDPQQKLEPIITKITGLTDEVLKGQPTFDELYPALVHFFSAADAVVAHNLPFDMTMVDLDCARFGLPRLAWPRLQICTVQEHAEEWGRRPKLLELYQHYTGEKLDQTHRAADDCAALAEICLLSGGLANVHSAVKSQD